MDRESNKLYAFHSIARLSCSLLRLEQQAHPRFPWMLVGMAGTGMVFLERDRYTLSVGGALIGGPGSMVLQAEKHAPDWSLFFIEFVPVPLPHASSDRSAAGAEEENVRASCRHAFHASELGVLAERLFSVVHMEPESPQRALTAHMLIQQMMLWWLSDEREEQGGPYTTDHAVQSALRYMETHFTEILTREQLAGKAGLNEAYFSVLCKKMTGMSPSVYLERLRVHRAAELLLQDKGRRGDLAEIARHSGFRDPWYMGKRFRKRLGMGPSAYKSSFVPERVASLKYPYTYHLLALGIRPSAARFSGKNDVIGPDVRESVVELPALLSIEGQKQLLLQNEPQLILTYDSAEIREKFRWVAPVIHIPWLSMSWREHMMMIGRLFHKEAEAALTIDSLDRQAAQVRQRAHAILPSGTRVSVFKIENKRCYLYGVRDTGCIFYEFLGFAPHPYIQQRIAQNPHFHSTEIPMRQMSEYAGELNFVILYPDVSEQSDFLRMNEYWRQFELAAERPVVFLDYREWLHYDPINIAVQLQKSVALLGPFGR